MDGDTIVLASSSSKGPERAPSPILATTQLVLEQKRLTLQEEILELDFMEGYVDNTTKTLVYWLLLLFTGVLPGFLLSYWFPIRALRFKKSRSPISTATYILVKGKDNHHEVCVVQPIARIPSNSSTAHPELTNSTQKMIVYKHWRFLFDPNQSEIEYGAGGRPIENKKDGIYKPISPLEALNEEYQRAGTFEGVTGSIYERLSNLYGSNLIDLPIPSIPVLLVQEVLHPFFVFQIYSVILWCTEEYFYYAAAIFFIATVTAIMSLWEIKTNMQNIRDLARYDTNVEVLRDGVISQVLSSSLVPGDLVVVPSRFVLPCDLLVVNGQCVVNESMLTGESIPVIKSPFPFPNSGSSSSSNGATKHKNIDFSKIDPRYILYGGTRVVELRVAQEHKVLGCVLSTGFQTSKGLLVLSILYPKPTHFKFFDQSLKFMGTLFLMALVGFAVAVYKLNSYGSEVEDIVQRGFDLITIVVPPALPMAMTVGCAFAMRELKRQHVFCVSPPRVNMAGKINIMCFDKTGTLTEEGLDLLGVRPSIESNGINFEEGKDSSQGTTLISNSPNFLEMVTNFVTSASEEIALKIEGNENGVDGLETSNVNPKKGSIPPSILMTMMTCHSLTHVENEVSGDPLETKIFLATGAVLEEPHITPGFNTKYVSVARSEGNSFGVLHQYEFIPALQRMSVVVEDLNSRKTYVCLKGSPEILYDMALKQSIPADFHSVLKMYTQQGYRVLACGLKEYPLVDNIDFHSTRAQAEEAVQFLGFIVMQNKLKPQTTPAIRLLNRANIRSVMVTGDNPLTAICIAKECEIANNGYNIFLGDLENNKIVWKDSNDPTLTLDPATLQPNKPVARFILAMTGKAFTHVLADYKTQPLPQYPFRQILSGGSIFARMSPENKASLVEEYQNLGLYAGMCGDGANDCIALRTAHVGVSLSTAEASVSAPFTSSVASIACIPLLLREGRSSLATSFQLFRFMALYSMIQFTTAIIITFKQSFLGNWEYLYEDLWTVFPLVILLGRSKSAKTLSRKRPSGRLFSVFNLSGTVGHILLVFLFQAIIYIRVERRPWYVDLVDHDLSDDSTNTEIFETTSLYLFANFQYLTVAWLFSLGGKWKQAIYTNYLFCLWWAMVLLTSVLILWVPDHVIAPFIQVIPIPEPWKLEIFLWALFNSAVFIAFEFGVVFLKSFSIFSRNKGNRRKQHKICREEFEELWGDNNQVKDSTTGIKLKLLKFGKNPKKFQKLNFETMKKEKGEEIEN